MQAVAISIPLARCFINQTILTPNTKEGSYRDAQTALNASVSFSGILSARPQALSLIICTTEVLFGSQGGISEQILNY